MQPVSQVLLKIEKALQDEIVTDSGITFYLDPTYKKEWQATVVGKIAALPIKSSKKNSSILSKLKVGDEVCVSYRVVADFTFKGDGHRFMQTTEDNPYKKEFINGKGEWVRKYALPKRSGLVGIVWVGVYTDKYGNPIDGAQGSEEDVDRWMSQFPFGKTDDYTFNNFFSYKGEDYWKCNIDDIYAISINGKLEAVGERVIGRFVEENVPEDIKNSILYDGDVKIRYQDRLRVLTGGKDLGLVKNNTVGINPNHLEKYTFYGKEYYLVKAGSITGKWSNN